MSATMQVTEVKRAEEVQPNDWVEHYRDGEIPVWKLNWGTENYGYVTPYSIDPDSAFNWQAYREWGKFVLSGTEATVDAAKATAKTTIDLPIEEFKARIVDELLEQLDETKAKLRAFDHPGKVSPLPASRHSAGNVAAAFEWLRAEATKPDATTLAGVAFDEWAALANVNTTDLKNQLTAQQPEFKRAEEATCELLEGVGITVSPEIVMAWSDDQIDSAEEYAATAHFIAQGNDPMEHLLPPMPAFLFPFVDNLLENKPHWATGLATSYMTVGAQLMTKDGRKTGNAVVMSVFFHDQMERSVASVCTDAGNTMMLTEPELKEFFHPPIWTMDVKTHPGIRAGAAEEVAA